MSSEIAFRSLTSSCSHPQLVRCHSARAKSGGFSGPTQQQCVAATTSRGSIKSGIDLQIPPSTTFPAPLVLPGDDLDLDPGCPPQSLRSWIQSKERNKVTPDRRTIYLAAPPGIDADVEFMRGWASPRRPKLKRGEKRPRENIRLPDVEDVRQYLEAFYFGMVVKMLPEPYMTFQPWDSTSTSTKQEIGLLSPSPSGPGLTAIRHRSTRSKDYPHQLNLDDLLDTAIASLPDDAYALIMLVEHDLYEDEDDEFVCGRAYGGSRVAVISTARYHPGLDERQNVEREHAWPASHCQEYVKCCCAGPEDSVVRTQSKKQKSAAGKIGEVEVIVIDSSDEEGQDCEKINPMRAAVAAYNGLPPLDHHSSSDLLTGAWLARVCRTAAHELGHCFGIGHCIYYACSMQGSASIVEDSRQPPYLCPVDLKKVLLATGADVTERYQALSQFCRSKDRYQTQMFRAFDAWITLRLSELKQ